MGERPPLNFAFLHPTWEINGVGTVQNLLADGLAARGRACWVAGTDLNQDEVPPGRRPSRATLHRLVSRPLPRTFLGARRPAVWFAHWLIVRRLGRWIRSLTNAVLFPGFDTGWTSLPGELWRRCPVVSVIHSDDRWWYDYARLVEARSRAIVAVSARVGRRLREMFPNRVVATIPNGVPCPRENPRAAGGMKPGPLRLIYAGRLAEEQKRVSRLPALCAALESVGVEFQLTIAGSGPEERSLRLAMAPWVERRKAVFLGAVARPELLGLLAEQDLFTLLSDYEGTPMAMLEAMAAGCVPMASAGMSGVEELVRDGENGLLVPAEDPGGQAARLRSLATATGARGQMSEAAWRTVRDGPWSLDAMVDSYLEVVGGLWADRKAGDAADGA